MPAVGHSPRPPSGREERPPSCKPASRGPGSVPGWPRSVHPGTKPFRPGATRSFLRSLVNIVGALARGAPAKLSPPLRRVSTEDTLCARPSLRSARPSALAGAGVRCSSSSPLSGRRTMRSSVQTHARRVRPRAAAQALPPVGVVGSSQHSRRALGRAPDSPERRQRPPKPPERRPTWGAGGTPKEGGRGVRGIRSCPKKARRGSEIVARRALPLALAT